MTDWTAAITIAKFCLSDWLQMQKIESNLEKSFEKTYPETTYKVEPQTESQPAQVESTEPIDYIEKLKEIKSLLDAGIINIDDFEKMKQKVIDNM